jgi:SAM-dependent methyltransferase
VTGPAIEQTAEGPARASSGIAAVGVLHGRLVFARRTGVLATALSQAIPTEARSVLDVGCGDGTIDAMLMERRPDLAITGVDVLVRPQTRVPVHAFDGKRLPFADGAFDVVTFVDVLHHTPDPTILLREARRVARMAIVLKDHLREGALAQTTLRFMDWVGNAHHNVVLPYNYWRKSEWTLAFLDLGLFVDHWNDRLGLYPAPASWVFERDLHFVARLITEG